MSRNRNPNVYVTKLSQNVRTKDLEHEFSRFGEIRSISLKNRFAFIEFEDYKDAELAIERMDGKTLDGERLIVEPAMGGGRRRERPRDRDYRDDSRDRHRLYERNKGPQKEDKCFNCGKLGHWANECRETSRSRGRYSREDVKCHNCGEKGHIKRDCKERKNSRSKSRSKSYSNRKRRRSRSRDNSRSYSKSRSRSNSRRRTKKRNSSSSSKEKK